VEISGVKWFFENYMDAPCENAFVGEAKEFATQSRDLAGASIFFLD
jgi:hypothetical protein